MSEKRVSRRAVQIHILCNRFCHPGGNDRNYHPGALSLRRVPVANLKIGHPYMRIVFTYGCPIFKRVAETWPHAWQSPQRPTGRHALNVTHVLQFWREPGDRLNIKMSSYQYRDPRVKDKSETVLSLKWESPYLWKTGPRPVTLRHKYNDDSNTRWISNLHVKLSWIFLGAPLILG